MKKSRLNNWYCSEFRLARRRNSEQIQQLKEAAAYHGEVGRETTACTMQHGAAPCEAYHGEVGRETTAVDQRSWIGSHGDVA